MLRKRISLMIAIMLALSLMAGAACAGSLLDGLFGGSEKEANEGLGGLLGGLFGSSEEDDMPPAFTGSALELTVSGKRVLVHEDFKQVMDEYEAFYDSYIDFLKSVDSDQLDMKKYNAFLKQSLELDEELDRISKTELSVGDELYMLEVTERIQKKLMDTLY